MTNKKARVFPNSNLEKTHKVNYNRKMASQRIGNLVFQVASSLVKLPGCNSWFMNFDDVMECTGLP